MELPNPTINPPPLHSSSARWSFRSHSRSPSRSPVRLQHFDPLLRDLSPTSTLRVFSAGPGDEPGHVVAGSIREATHVERALGIKAAQTCLDVRSWARELELWEWPGTFGESGQQGLPGSLTTQRVHEYSRRLSEVGEQLDEVDVEELKDFVLSAHSQASSAPADIDDSIGAIGAATDLKKLDDFTALITATILQTLPYLSRLHRLLTTWNIRVAILTAVPAFLQDLARAREDLKQSWENLQASSTAAEGLDGAMFDRDSVQHRKSALSTQISSLGRRLDNFLDRLEGRPETVPDSWIDDFEALESQYGNWVVLAERKVLEYEWNQLNVLKPKYEQLPIPVLQSERSESDISGYGEDSGVLLNTVSEPEPKSSQPEVQDFDMAAEELLGRATIGVDPIDSVLASLNDEHDPSTLPAASPHSEHGTVTRSRGESETSLRTSPSPETRSKYIPLAVASKQYGELLSNYEALDTRSLNSTFSATTDSDASTAPPTVKSRAALFNRDFEKVGTLNKSKSPPVVRPFEHASNAFTRLFKKTASPDQQKKFRSTSANRSLHSMASADRLASGSRTIEVENSTFHTSAPSVTANAAETQVSKDPDISDVRAVDASVSAIQADEDPEDTIHDQRSSVGQSSSSRPTTPWDGPVPETYIPTGMLSSPFHSPEKDEFTLETEESSFQDVPPNWPLSNEVSARPSHEGDAILPHSGVYDDKVHQSRAIGGTGAFNQMFVDSLGQSKGNLSQMPQDSKPSYNYSDGHSAFPAKTRQLLMDETLALDGDLGSRDVSDVADADRAPLAHSSRIAQEPTLPRPISTVVEEGWPLRPEVPVLPNQDNMATNDGLRAVPVALIANEPLNATGNTSIYALNRSPSLPSLAAEQAKASIATIRHASRKSIESFPRSKLKSIDVPAPPRRHSASSALFQNDSGTPLMDGSGVLASDQNLQPASPPDFQTRRRSESGASLLSYGGKVFPTPPSRKSSLRNSPPSPDDSPSAAKARMISDAGPQVQSGLLNAVITKRRQVVPEARETDESTTSNTVLAMKQGGDNFDRHVSAVLDRVHAPIRFKTRLGAESSLGFRAGEAKSSNGLRPKNSRLMPKGNANMTLAPAEPTAKKSRSGVDEVKVYHLSTGRDDPIKLFVRLVGEDQRVMVRVGGGWADLADYLKQYADHHGSRTVSEGGFEVQAVGTSNASASTPGSALNTGVGSAAKRTFSMPVEISARAKTPRPTTPLVYRTTTGESTRSAEADREWLSQPQPKFTMGDDSSSDVEDSKKSTRDPTGARQLRTPITTTTTSTTTTTTTSITTRPGGTTPKSASSVKSSIPRPVTSDAPPLPTPPAVPTASYPLVGLAGPSSAKKSDLAEQKARWVEDMLGRAKASAEKRRDKDEDKEKGFADLGTVGGTKRVVFRRHSGAGGGGGL